MRTLASEAVRSQFVDKDTSFGQTLDVLLGVCSQTTLESTSTVGLGATTKHPSELAISLATGTDDALVEGDFGSQGLQVVTEVVGTEAGLEAVHGDRSARLDILPHVLLEFIHVILSVGKSHEVPGTLSIEILDVIVVDLAHVGAVTSNMA